MDLLHGAIVGDRYEVLGPIGEGGMAIVYRVRHLQLGTTHALKVLMAQSDVVHARLMAEGRVQAALRHPNVVAVTDVVEIIGRPGLILEFVRGPSLDRLIAQRNLAWAEVDAIVIGILDGVAAAHAMGIVHRDLKPSNVLIEITPRGLVPKVADFGLVKVLSIEGPGISPTRSGSALGTPAYMAPEQIRDARTVDFRADVFSLGAILYEIACGKPAFGGRDMLETFNQVANGERSPLRAFAPDAPERIVRAIDLALEVDLERRCSSVAELRALWLAELSPQVAVSWDPVLIDAARHLVPVSNSGAAAAAGTMARASMGDRTLHTPHSLGGEAEVLRAPPPPALSKSSAILAPPPPPPPSHPPPSHPPGPMTLTPVPALQRAAILRSPLPLLAAGLGLVAFLAFVMLGPGLFLPPPPAAELVQVPEVVPPSPTPVTPELPIEIEPEPTRPVRLEARMVGDAVREPRHGTVVVPAHEPVQGAVVVPGPAPTVSIDADVTVVLRDATGRPADLQHLTPGDYTVVAFWEHGVASEEKQLTLAPGDTVSIRCSRLSTRCAVVRP